MNDLSVLASVYVVFLASTSALLTRASDRHQTADWPHGELPRLCGVLARTLLVLAGFIVVVVVAIHHEDLQSFACMGLAALIVGGAARSTWRS